jgi:CRISPR-associated protein Csx17
MSDGLQALRFDGIRPDSLGNYLAGLGLLSALASNPEWGGLRGCWRGGCFTIVGNGLTPEHIEMYLLDWRPTPYSRWWTEKQKADTKSKRDQNIWRARSAETLPKVRVLDAHIVGVGRNQFNPVFGTGGNIGKRDLAKVYETACTLIRKSEASRWLKATLYAGFDSPMPDLTSAGTWFVYANKTFNSGQDWYREGQMSPWSFLLAMEGALLLVGGAARRLGANARPYAVFPFVTDMPSPQSEGEVGLVKAEFWAPIWRHPATLPEVRGLLERGLARIGQRAAKAPFEFAIAARSAAVDAGVEEFIRFALRQTTSSNAYEAVPAGRVRVAVPPDSESSLVGQIVPWLDFLPRDAKKFYGLRGPVEDAIIRLAERPDDPERWQRLWLLQVDVQSRIDRSKNLRQRCRALNWLGTEWFKKGWPSPPVEIRIARAIATIGCRSEMPLLVNVFGLELSKNKTPVFSGESRPQRAIWHNGEVVSLLADLLERRLVDTDAALPLPLNACRFSSAPSIGSFLSNAVDTDMIGRWVPALSLIRWSKDQVTSQETSIGEFHHCADATFLLQALFRPLFYPRELYIGSEELFPDRLRPRAAMARRLLNLIRQGELGEAVQLAKDRYLAAGRSIVLPPSDISGDYERIAASLLIPMKPSDTAVGLRRWLQPYKKGNPR